MVNCIIDHGYVKGMWEMRSDDHRMLPRETWSPPRSRAKDVFVCVCVFRNGCATDN